MKKPTPYSSILLYSYPLHVLVSCPTRPCCRRFHSKVPNNQRATLALGGIIITHTHTCLWLARQVSSQGALFQMWLVRNYICLSSDKCLCLYK